MIASWPVSLVTESRMAGVPNEVGDAAMNTTEELEIPVRRTSNDVFRTKYFERSIRHGSLQKVSVSVSRGKQRRFIV
jgi:hypothetical protein